MEPQLNQQRGMFNYYYLIFLFVILIIILFLAYIFYNLQPVDFNDASLKEIVINKGDGLKEIALILSRNNLIKSIFVFKLYNFFTGSAHQLKAGVYDLSANMSLPEIVKILKEGKVKRVKITVLEGYTLKDVDSLLKENKVLINSSLLDLKIDDLKEKFPFLNNVNSLEGFIFPDTYLFNINMQPKEVVEIFLNNFLKKAWIKLKDKENWYQILIMASLLEKEVPDFNDRQLVAGILFKRLKNNMPLQVDATITYIKCNGLIRSCKDPEPKRIDLGISSLYNTYQHLGLPPTPISNPGETAIEAALNPKESKYWYYLSPKNQKITIFSKTLEEHNFNILKYLK